MQTIETYYIGITAKKGNRVKAIIPGGKSITLSLEELTSSITEDSTEQIHMSAAMRLCKVLNWPGSLVGGHTKKGMVWVFINEYAPQFTVEAANAR